MQGATPESKSFMCHSLIQNKRRYVCYTRYETNLAGAFTTSLTHTPFDAWTCPVRSQYMKSQILHGRESEDRTKVKTFSLGEGPLNKAVLLRPSRVDGDPMSSTHNNEMSVEGRQPARQCKSLCSQSTPWHDLTSTLIRLSSLYHIRARPRLLSWCAASVRSGLR